MEQIKITIEVEKIAKTKSLFNGSLIYQKLNINFTLLSLEQILQHSKIEINIYFDEENIKIEPKDITFYFKFR
jgi:hypothetical protein